MRTLILALATLSFACGGAGSHSATGDKNGSKSSGTTIGSAGGSVSLANGPTLTFAAGALSADTTVTIQDTGETSADGGPVFEFLPAGLEFPASSVLVTIPIPVGVTTPSIYWTQLGSATAFDELSTAVDGANATAHVAHFSFGYAGSCTNVCEDAFSGTSSSVIGATPIDAAVTWQLDAITSTSQKSSYYPVGTVSVHSFTNANGCLVSYSPASYEINGHNNGGGLSIDHTTDPPTYSGQGITEWLAAVTMACPGGSVGTSSPLPTGGLWFVGQGALTNSGSTIAGTGSAIGQTFTYSFTR